MKGPSTRVLILGVFLTKESECEDPGGWLRFFGLGRLTPCCELIPFFEMCSRKSTLVPQGV